MAALPTTLDRCGAVVVAAAVAAALLATYQVSGTCRITARASDGRAVRIEYMSSGSGPQLFPGGVRRAYAAVGPPLVLYLPLGVLCLRLPDPEVARRRHLVVTGVLGVLAALGAVAGVSLNVVEVVQGCGVPYWATMPAYRADFDDIATRLLQDRPSQVLNLQEPASPESTASSTLPTTLASPASPTSLASPSPPSPASPTSLESPSPSSPTSPASPPPPTPEAALEVSSSDAQGSRGAVGAAAALSHALVLAASVAAVAVVGRTLRRRRRLEGGDQWVRPEEPLPDVKTNPEHFY